MKEIYIKCYWHSFLYVINTPYRLPAVIIAHMTQIFVTDPMVTRLVGNSRICVEYASLCPRHGHTHTCLCSSFHLILSRSLIPFLLYTNLSLRD